MQENTGLKMHGTGEMRKNNRKIFIFVLILLLGLLNPAACYPEPARNVILLIGDGMGGSQIALGRYYNLLVNGQDLRMTEVMKRGSTGYLATHSEGSLVTDSAAAATAMATGYKTNNGMIGMTPDGVHRTTILETARAKGKKVGLVTTARVTHATPAAFASHTTSRHNEDIIAGQMIELGVGVILGGGRRHFLPDNRGGSRGDGRDLLSEAEKMGYRVVKNRQGLVSLELKKIDKLLGLFNGDHMSYELRRNKDREPSLREMAAVAIEVLDKNERGFFLMIEGGRIDHAGHANHDDNAAAQLLAFDEAVGLAFDYALENGETLIIVTADHETGGLAIVDGVFNSEKLPHKSRKGFSAKVKKNIKVGWATKGHTAEPVWIFAYGPGSEKFTGFMDNTDVFKIMAGAVNGGN